MPLRSTGAVHSTRAAPAHHRRVTTGPETAPARLLRSPAPHWPGAAPANSFAPDPYLKGARGLIILRRCR